ncbi:DNA recombination protein RmuC [Amorphus orientalis]|uniref:DNA recombination protein RmuC homolog n=1 Tax=Amorphus orientalis TaxID=649198 RepID=A0AAE3VS48_9HYPH|nr:DNA recombination protein RmuC [Amorphus orientalis]MDQ0317374.1 DNA recombination protein RmuC [Amorphus orientalis]
MSDSTFVLFGRTLTVAEALIAISAVALLALFLVLVALVRANRSRTATERAAEEKSRALEAQMAELMRMQSETSGRLQTVAEVFGSRQSEMTRALSERLDGMGHRLGSSMSQASNTTHDTLRQLHERLAVIDSAQKTMSGLSDQVTQLERIFSDKQSRGAFGQGRMEAIVRDGLPEESFTFQPTLSNNSRPDCAIHLPNGAPDLMIDAKFPLESFSRIEQAETEQDLKEAQQAARRDLIKHIDDVRKKYLIPGETQDLAFVFVPSESLFAQIHERFPEVVQRAYRARVVVLSPTLLHLAIQVVVTVIRDARIREEAHVIRAEVGHLMDDVNRLFDRVMKLQQHFGQAQKDVEQIVISAEKVSKRGSRIEALEMETDGEAQEPRPTRAARAS